MFSSGTRLLVRERYEYKRWLAPLIVEPTEAISFVMSQKMLRGIRDRAERPADFSSRRLRDNVASAPATFRSSITG